MEKAKFRGFYQCCPSPVRLELPPARPKLRLFSLGRRGDESSSMVRYHSRLSPLVSDRTTWPFASESRTRVYDEGQYRLASVPVWKTLRLETGSSTLPPLVGFVVGKASHPLSMSLLPEDASHGRLWFVARGRAFRSEVGYACFIAQPVAAEPRIGTVFAAVWGRLVLICACVSCPWTGTQHAISDYLGKSAAAIPTLFPV